MSESEEKYIEIVFHDHELGLGITLRRADDGSIFVMDIVPNRSIFYLHGYLPYLVTHLPIHLLLIAQSSN